MAQTFRHPDKWRDTIDPFSLPFHSFTLAEVLGYPHAGNDVFHVRGFHEGEEVTAYIKVARQKGAAIGNEVALLRQIDHPAVPRVLDAGEGEQPFSVVTEKPGLRLSVILGENADNTSCAYMPAYGEALAWIHSLHLEAQPVADRRFFHVPTDDMLDALNLHWLKDFFSVPPAVPVTVFCHGDFHYANMLWEDHHVSAMLDFELAGMGNRDFDIAWALIRRPGQRFLRTKEERKLFLEGYQSRGECCEQNVLYYMAQIYVYWLKSCQDDEAYCREIRAWLEKHCR